MSEHSTGNDAPRQGAKNPHDQPEASSIRPKDKVQKNDELKTKVVEPEKSFEELSEESSVGIVREFIDFLKYNKKWWLTPIIAVLLLVGVLIILTTSGAAPFLYTFW